MSDENPQTLDPTNALSMLDSIDLTNVSTAAPMLPSGIYEVTVAEVKIEPQRAPKVGSNIKIKLTLNNPAEDVDGKPVNPGFPIYDQFSLTPTEKYTLDMIKQACARFKEGVTGDKSGTFTPLEQYIGRTAKIQLAYDPDRKDKQGQSMGPGNSVKRYIKP